MPTRDPKQPDLPIVNAMDALPHPARHDGSPLRVRIGGCAGPGKTALTVAREPVLV